MFFYDDLKPCKVGQTVRVTYFWCRIRVH